MTRPFRRRSALFAPANRFDLLAKMTRAEPDAVVLDLEDGTPHDAKGAARQAIERALAEIDFGQAEIVIRINSMDSTFVAEDIAWLTGRQITCDAIMVPKVDHPDHLTGLLARLGRSVPLWILPTETALGYRNLQGSLEVPEVTAVIWAAEDFAADIGADGSRHADGTLREVFRVARAQTLLAAKAAGISAIDTTYVDIEDLEGLRREAELCRDMGFDGKAAIHPSHVEVINEVYQPSGSSVDRARRLVEAFEAAGGGAIRFEDHMIDAPHYKQAQRVLARAGIRDAVPDQSQ